MIQPGHQSDRLIVMMIYGWGFCLITLADLHLVNVDSPAPIEIAATEAATLALQIEVVTSRGKPVPGRARHPKSENRKTELQSRAAPGRRQPGPGFGEGMTRLTAEPKPIPPPEDRAKFDAQSDEPFGRGSIVVVGTQRGSFMAEVRKVTKKDIVIRALSRPIR